MELDAVVFLMIEQSNREVKRGISITPFVKWHRVMLELKHCVDYYDYTTKIRLVKEGVGWIWWDVANSIDMELDFFRGLKNNENLNHFYNLYTKEGFFYDRVRFSAAF